MSNVKIVKHRNSHNSPQRLIERGDDMHTVAGAEIIDRAVRSLSKLLVNTTLVNTGLPGRSTFWSSKISQHRVGLFAGLVGAAVLSRDGLTAAAGSVKAKLTVSARVVRSCKIAPTPLFLSTSRSQAIDDSQSEIGSGNGLKIACHRATVGMMALGVGANMAGNAVIRVIATDGMGAGTVKESYISHDETNSSPRPIDLGLFPTAGTKVILHQSENRLSARVPPVAGTQTITLSMDF